MTNNYQRAVEILNRHWGIAKETGMADETECCVEALEESGLLMPDLPTLKSDYASIEAPVHYSLVGHDDDCVRYDSDSILAGTWYREIQFSLGKYDEVAAYMSIEQSRDFARALLAAANYAEKGQTDGNV